MMVGTVVGIAVGTVVVEFHKYYTNEIAPDITSIARWVIEPYGVYDPYSGIPNNQAESLNFVLKQLQEWREAPIHCMALALHHLQSYYLVEIARGQHGLGNYHLHSQYLQLRELTPIPTSSFSPDEIVSRIRGKLAHSTEQEQTSQGHLSNSKHDSGTQFSQVERARLQLSSKTELILTQNSTLLQFWAQSDHMW